MFPSQSVTRTVIENKKSVKRTFPPTIHPTQIGHCQTYLPKLALKFLVKPGIRFDEVVSYINTEAKRQRYFPSIIILTLGAADAADPTQDIATIRAKVVSAIRSLKYSFLEVVPDQTYPFGVKRLVVISVPPSANEALFMDTQDPPQNRRQLLNEAIHSACLETDILWVELEHCISTEIKDAAAQFHNMATGFHVSPQVGALITFDLFDLLYKILIEAHSGAKV
jgi:hypothetical protein